MTAIAEVRLATITSVVCIEVAIVQSCVSVLQSIKFQLVRSGRMPVHLDLRPQAYRCN